MLLQGHLQFWHPVALLSPAKVREASKGGKSLPAGRLHVIPFPALQLIVKYRPISTTPVFERHFSTAQSSSGHWLCISAFVIASKSDVFMYVTCGDLAAIAVPMDRPWKVVHHIWYSISTHNLVGFITLIHWLYKWTKVWRDFLPFLAHAQI
jgi:hypothetical protein